MFKQASTPKFWASPKVEFTKEDGSRGTLSFDVQYKRLSVPDVRALTAKNEGVDDADLFFMQAVVTDWKKVTDDDGAEVAFSSEALQQLYDLGFGGAVVKTFFASFARAKEKN